MTIKQYGGVFGRNPSFNDASVETLSIAGTALSSTAAELNILDGVTADATELNYLDGASTSVVTASKAVLANASANIAFASGKGIDFSATAGTGTSELFDDYEEGTWTPSYNTVNDDLSFGSYVRQIGYYRKIGDTVHLWGAIQTNGVSSYGTGALTIETLPFASLNTPSGLSFSGVVSVANEFSGANDYPNIVEVAENNTIILVKAIDLTTGQPFNIEGTNSYIKNAANSNFIVFAVSYIAA